MADRLKPTPVDIPVILMGARNQITRGRCYQISLRRFWISVPSGDLILLRKELSLRKYDDYELTRGSQERLLKAREELLKNLTKPPCQSSPSAI